MITINEEQYEAGTFATIEDAFRALYQPARYTYLARLNDDFVLRTLWESTEIADGDVLTFVPIISGG